MAASVACTSLYNLPPLSTGLGCFCCLYQPVQPAFSFYWSWLLLLLVPACTTCLLFLLVLAASVACTSLFNLPPLSTGLGCFCCLYQPVQPASSFYWSWLLLLPVPACTTCLLFLLALAASVACTSLYNLPPLSTGLGCFCYLYQPVQPASSFYWSWLLLLLVPACTTCLLFLLVLAASVACTSLYNLPPLSTGLGCFCCLYQPVQPASSFYWPWLLLLLVPACTTCLLFLLVLAASVACTSLYNLPPLSTGLGCFCCLYQPVQPASSFYWPWLLLLPVPACTTCLLFLLALAASVTCTSLYNLPPLSTGIGYFCCLYQPVQPASSFYWSWLLLLLVPACTSCLLFLLVLAASVACTSLYNLPPLSSGLGCFCCLYQPVQPASSFYWPWLLLLPVPACTTCLLFLLALAASVTCTSLYNLPPLSTGLGCFCCLYQPVQPASSFYWSWLLLLLVPACTTCLLFLLVLTASVACTSLYNLPPLSTGLGCFCCLYQPVQPASSFYWPWLLLLLVPACTSCLLFLLALAASVACTSLYNLPPLSTGLGCFCCLYQPVQPESSFYWPWLLLLLVPACTTCLLFLLALAASVACASLNNLSLLSTGLGCFCCLLFS